ncbi:MAG TPA: DCC1-like thiol-disulfide oxidoreductase family protein [Rhizomicrobium sp.]|nr:DCC1-like thiol-disulfide oxidoreductase family protein [Rhizomicrobium sp.]
MGQDTLEIVYDGQCPVCATYVRMYALRQNGFDVRLTDARAHPDLVTAYAARGIDLNHDFVVRVGAREYHGGEGMFVLTALSTSNSFFGKLNAALFRSRTMSLFLYPVLRFCRAVLLFFLGRPPIRSST